MKKIIVHLGLTCVLVVSLSGCIVELGFMAMILVDSMKPKPKPTTIHLPDAVVGVPYSALIAEPEHKLYKEEVKKYEYIEVNPDNLDLLCNPCFLYDPDTHKKKRTYDNRGTHGGFYKVTTIEGIPTATGTVTINATITTFPTMNKSAKEYKTIYKINIIDAKEPKKIEQDKENAEDEK